MDSARIYVDLNEMVTEDIFLLSREDTKADSLGNIVTFYDRMPVKIYSDDASSTGETDHLIAEGIAIRYDLKSRPGWEHVKWCVRIAWNTLMHESDLKFLQLLPEEIKKHSDDLPALRACLMDFKSHGMSRDSMLDNLERLKTQSAFQTKDVLSDLMDFVVGWCNPVLSIYNETGPTP